MLFHDIPPARMISERSCKCRAGALLRGHRGARTVVDICAQAVARYTGNELHITTISDMITEQVPD